MVTKKPHDFNPWLKRGRGVLTRRNQGKSRVDGSGCGTGLPIYTMGIKFFGLLRKSADRQLHSLERNFISFSTTTPVDSSSRGVDAQSGARPKPPNKNPSRPLAGPPRASKSHKRAVDHAVNPVRHLSAIQLGPQILLRPLRAPS